MYVCMCNLEQRQAVTLAYFFNRAVVTTTSTLLYLLSCLNSGLSPRIAYGGDLVK
jgi:hypothetical protein